jgi:carbamoyl-phosphate synthase large subunit
VPAETIFKVNEGRPHVVDQLLSGQIQMVVNTPLGAPSYYDERAIRFTALQRRVPLITTLTGAASAVEAIRAARSDSVTYRSLQEIHTR